MEIHVFTYSQVVQWQNKRDNKRDGWSWIETRPTSFSQCHKEEIVPHFITQMKWHDLRMNLESFSSFWKRGKENPKYRGALCQNWLPCLSSLRDQDKKLTQETEGKPLTEFQFSRSHCSKPKLAFVRLKHINVCWLLWILSRKHTCNITN